MRISFDEAEIAVPRDCKGEFEPQLLKKNQTTISQDMEERCCPCSPRGLTTGGMEAHIRKIYVLDVSDPTSVGKNESARYWLTVLNNLKNRGVEDILIACTDNLTGFTVAVEAVYTRTEVQSCIIHQLRNSGRYVFYKDLM